jgi:hypothetical protein
MFLPIITFFAILPFCICDISLLAFDDSQCAGDRVGINVHSNPGAQFEGSGCQAIGAYSSVNVLSLDAGFKCNLYADDQCQSFLASATQVGCVPVIGKGVICFSQASFDNPLAGSQGRLGIGSTTLIASYSDIANSVGQLVDKVCGTGICDTTTKDITTFTLGTDCESGLANVDGNPTLTVCDKHETCTQTLTVDGQFTNTNQKDYMRETLKTAMAQDYGGGAPKDASSDFTRGLVSFAGVQINDAKGALLALVRSTLLTGFGSATSTSLDYIINLTSTDESYP